MKTNMSHGHTMRVLAVIFGALLVMAWPLSTAAAAPAKKDESGLGSKLEQWQEKMSEKFRDTWKGFRGEEKKNSGTASLDLREDSEHYTVRLNLPDRDLQKVDIKMEGGKLHIAAPAGVKAGKYAQTITLAGADPAAPPKIERKPHDNMIVVTVPKSSTVASNKSTPAIPDPSLTPLSDWDRGIFERMDKMRREMDRAFDESFREFRDGPGFKGFFEESRFGSSFDLKEEGDNYVVRAYLPNREMKNVNVTVEQQTLKIEAKEQETTKHDDPAHPLHSSVMAAYSQIITLPGPVQADKMKVDKKEGMLVVTLRKAKQT
jgi:HSP20 family protein